MQPFMHRSPGHVRGREGGDPFADADQRKIKPNTATTTKLRPLEIARSLEPGVDLLPQRGRGGPFGP